MSPLTIVFFFSGQGKCQISQRQMSNNLNQMTARVTKGKIPPNQCLPAWMARNVAGNYSRAETNICSVKYYQCLANYLLVCKSVPCQASDELQSELTFN
jgi:hypothetical protein